MKIFKNRGDIYFSKNEYKSSREERILLILLVFIVLFTVVFFGVLSHKYSSVKEFFAGNDVTTTLVAEDDENALPEIEGKRNFLVFETDKEQGTIHFAFLVQADADNKAYKVCALSPDTAIDEKSLYEIFSTGGGAALQAQLTSYLGIDIDFYAEFKNDGFVEFVNKMGSFVYPSPEDVKYNFDDDDDPYAVRIKKGESKISGTELSQLLRYYSRDNQNLERANQIILYGLTGLFNESNFKDNLGLFRLFVGSSKTNITVRNYQEDLDILEVFCKQNNDIAVNSVNILYADGAITPEAAREIKTNFSK